MHGLHALISVVAELRMFKAGMSMYKFSEECDHITMLNE